MTQVGSRLWNHPMVNKVAPATAANDPSTEENGSAKQAQTQTRKPSTSTRVGLLNSNDVPGNSFNDSVWAGLANTSSK